MLLEIQNCWETGEDRRAAPKLTYVAVYGLQEAKHAAQRLATEASEALANFDEALNRSRLAFYAIQRSIKVS